jgi:4-amino-4-deoxy-L-arabinose transferase-like glycosyltransferase
MPTKAGNNSRTYSLNYRYRPDRRGVLSLLTRSESTVFFMVLLFYIGCRLWYLDYGLWNDEVFSVWTARLNWTDLVGRVVEDIVHPPLFYLLLKCWILIGGESLFWLRLFPAITAMAALVPFYLLCRELKLGALAVNLALVLMSVNEFLVTWAQNLRMYSLLLFFTLWSLWLFGKFLNSPSERTKLLLGLFAVNLCLVYTQNYGWLVIAAELFYVLVFERRSFLPLAISVACVSMAFVPWAYAVAEAATNKEGLSQLNWIARPDWRDFIAYFGTLNGLFLRDMRIAALPTFFGALLFSYPIFLWAWHVNVKAQSEQAHRADVATFWFLVVFAFLPPILCYVFSQVFPQSFWQQRHLIISAVPYLILVAVSVDRLRPQWLRKATVVALLGWAVLAGFDGINREKISWKFLVDQMIRAEASQSTEINVYALTSNLSAPMMYYLELAKERRFQVVQTKEAGSLGETHFWVAVKESPWEKTHYRQPLKQYLMNREYQVGEGFESGPQGQRAFLFPVWSLK